MACAVLFLPLAARAQSSAEAGAVAAELVAAQAPSAQISNGLVKAKIFLPDVNRGFYRGTRFDWSGVIASLTLSGREYYGLWFTKISSGVRDYQYDQDDVVAGPNTAITGPAEEFGADDPLGWGEAQAGGVFIKIGVGALRRPDAQKYDRFKVYDLVDAGHWTIKARQREVSFTQQLSVPAAGYGYRYNKILRLDRARARLTIAHTLKNTGQRIIATSLYDHNFLTFGVGVGAGIDIDLPFQVHSSAPSAPDVVAIDGQGLRILKTLQGRDRISMPIEGFGQGSSDYRIKLSNRPLGMTMAVSGDHPLTRLQLWAIRPVIAIEPTISLRIDPGHTAQWTYIYDYSTDSQEPKTK